MDLGSDIKAEVTALIETLGKDLTLTKVTEGTYDRESATFSGADTDDYDAFGVLYDYDNQDIDDSRVERGDRICTIQAEGLSVVPVTGDRVSDDSTTYTVVYVRTYEVGGVVAAYEMQVRVA